MTEQRPEMTEAATTHTTDLSGTWTLSSLDAKHTLTMPVPGDVHSALLAAGIIPDPYVGRNEADVQWVAEQDWVLERTFDIDASELSGNWYLDIESLDTVAEVYLNDEAVLHAENAFRRYRPEVGSVLKAGQNRLRIV
ncbi:MAG: glycoside hydrolase family 2 protein, partial [Pararhizobium sp.]